MFNVENPNSDLSFGFFYFLEITLKLQSIMIKNNLDLDIASDTYFILDMSRQCTLDLETSL